MPTPTELLDQEDVRRDVDDALSLHLDALRDRMLAVDEATLPLLHEAEQLLAGGKRLRAAFCYWSWRAHGGRADSADRSAAIGTGAALELFQAAALVHDDVMDRSDTRRGRPAAHRAFAAVHRAQGWDGNPDEFGTNAAILLGDLLLSSCGEKATLATADLDPGVAARVRAVFDLMQAEVTVGQFLDVRAQVMPWGVDLDADEARSRAIIRAKSARYSVEHPMALGAAIAGADPASVRAYGLPFGEAFQLRDDLLGVFGDPAVTGKPAGDDLREGKRTVLVSRALRSASEAERETVMAALGDEDLTGSRIDDVRTILVSTGAVDEVEALIENLADAAESALRDADLDESGRAVLLALGRAAAQRRV
ncbi:polyprenyl synthetase family protein [Paraoerskovia marina]|uniref:polyprenyl synthetase family protein n=1 Tax=Paraoerskovia marina TaxID=545619 RepID=UPI000492CAD2|nr:polyprenyl synthetase family protein [Paraoerskovia marina]